MGWDGDLASQSFFIMKHPSFVTGEGSKHEFSVESGGEFEVHSYGFTGTKMVDFKNKVAADGSDTFHIKHINNGWQMNRQFGQYVDVVPAQMRTGDQWYQGTADAIYQNLNLINDEDPDYVAVFGADHIFKMDISRMLNAHRTAEAKITVAAIPKTLEQAKEFGVINKKIIIIKDITLGVLLPLVTLLINRIHL